MISILILCIFGRDKKRKRKRKNKEGSLFFCLLLMIYILILFSSFNVRIVWILIVVSWLVMI